MKQLNGNIELCRELAERNMTKDVFFLGIGDSKKIPFKDFKWIATQYNDLFLEHGSCEHFLTAMGKTAYVLFYNPKKAKFEPQLITKKLIFNFRKDYELLKDNVSVGKQIDIDEICEL